jgi:phosphoglycolate phosphatase
MPAPFPFDVVVFDLDGTLLATDRFWVQAARVGAKRAFRELGIERPMPSAEEWMGLVGLPLAEGFDGLFSDLGVEQRARVLARCVEEEHLSLARGEAALLPGVREALETLRERGVRMGIASNCGKSYLEAALEGLGLCQWIEAARCLDSPGIATKTDMVRDLLWTFGTRSAVMVGDRRGDRDAAHANGLPHLHLSSGFAPAGEVFECEALLGDFLELVPRLEGRGAWLDDVLARVGHRGGGGPRRIGVTGGHAAGKSLLARDLARRLAARGREVSLISLEDFRLPDAAPAGGAPEDLPEATFDLDALLEEVLEPHARGEAVQAHRRRVVDDEVRTTSVELEPGAVLLLEGPALLHPRLATRLDRVVHVAVDEALALRRVAARDVPLEGAPALERAHRRLATERAFDLRYPPADRADLLLDGSNPLGPGLTGAADHPPRCTPFDPSPRA